MEIGAIGQSHKPALLQDGYVAQLRKQNLVNRWWLLESPDNRLVEPASPHQRLCSAPYVDTSGCYISNDVSRNKTSVKKTGNYLAYNGGLHML